MIRAGMGREPSSPWTRGMWLPPSIVHSSTPMPSGQPSTRAAVLSSPGTFPSRSNGSPLWRRTPLQPSYVAHMATVAGAPG